jgi:hypothetical protein
MIVFAENPIPVVTPMGDGILIYVKENGIHENDVWTVTLTSNGKIMHFKTNQIRIHSNSTYNIQKDENFK